MSKHIYLISRLIIVLFIFLAIPGVAGRSKLLKKIERGCPDWMRKQIHHDLEPHRERGISKGELCGRYLEIPEDLYLARVEIKNNRVSYETKSQVEGVHYRLNGLLQAFEDLCRYIGLQDSTFIITLHDGLCQPDLLAPTFIDFPLFVMSRGAVLGYQHKSILIPDYEGLYECFQVLEKEDITKYKVKWNKKKPLLVWRGSTAQAPYNFEFFAKGDNQFSSQLCSEKMNEQNAHYFSRYLLCEMSLQYPNMIDARYTFLCNLEKTFPRILDLQGEWMSFEEQLDYKYQIFLNGNAAPYSNSGWKFFSNSVIFYPVEPFMSQWYFNALKPYVHYVPVKENLEDLIAKLHWARNHDEECKQIAKNARNFALNNLTRDDYLLYFYFLLKEYSLLLRD